MLSFLFYFLSTLALANTNLVEAEQANAPTREQQRHMLESNRRNDVPANPSLVVRRPFVEYHQARYLLMSDTFSFDSSEAKYGMLRGLPENMVALILTDHASKIPALEATVAKLLHRSRFRVLTVPGGSGFWVRDSIPVAVYAGPETSPAMALTGAKYFGGQRPGPRVSSLLHVPFFEHSYYYEGGNFIADKNGVCFAIDHRIEDISDSTFSAYYGCSKIVRLPFRAGIGHVDERVKFISDEVAVTDEPTYVATLQHLGYETYLLPRPTTHMGTYANALLVNGTLFMPSYGEQSDQKAEAIYKSFGLKVVPLDSKRLSSSGLGSLHCITMTYPSGTLDALWKSLKQSTP